MYYGRDRCCSMMGMPRTYLARHDKYNLSHLSTQPHTQNLLTDTRLVSNSPISTRLILNLKTFSHSQPCPITDSAAKIEKKRNNPLVQLVSISLNYRLRSLSCTSMLSLKSHQSHQQNSDLSFHQRVIKRRSWF